MIRIQSPQAKKVLATHLAETNPKMLEFIQAAAQSFGPMREIGFEGVGEKELRAELMQIGKG